MAEVGTTVTANKTSTGRSVKMVTFAWTSDASGDVSGGAVSNVVDAEVIAHVSSPNLAGTQPTNLYDVTILDDNSLDILGAQGANMVNTGDNYNFDSKLLGAASASTLTVVVANAGNAKTGTEYIWVR